MKCSQSIRSQPSKWHPRIGKLLRSGAWRSDLPVDVLDNICQMHDRCYAEVGYLKCVCDATLITLVNNNLSKMSSNARPVAIAISAYFTVSPCVN